VKTALFLAVALIACSSNSKAQPDSSTPPMIDAPATMPDAPVTAATLTSFVIDLVVNQTASNTPPVAYATFATLPDPDGASNNLTAYSSLFQ
jgi:hypothetical protein